MLEFRNCETAGSTAPKSAKAPLAHADSFMIFKSNSNIAAIKKAAAPELYSRTVSSLDRDRSTGAVKFRVKNRSFVEISEY